MRNPFGKRQSVHASDPESAQANRMRQDPLLSELSHDLAVTRGILLGGFTIGLLTVLLMWIFKFIHHGFTAFFWALASFAGGSLVGFLFGIPRVFQREGGFEAPRSNTASDPALATDGKTQRSSYQLVINTNLDDISDWLTKIAVGVGLVELQKIPRFLYRVSSVIGAGMSEAPDLSSAVPFIMALLLYFTTAGFMSGYLTTRMFFQRAFRIADLHATGSDHRRTITKTQTVEEVEKRSGATAG